jgi:hypothetical protein
MDETSRLPHPRGTDSAGAGRDARRHERAAVIGLTAVIEESPRGDAGRYEVLDVSEHGMGIRGLALPVGVGIRFTLAGAGMNHVGLARVAHRTDMVTGVAVDHWDGAPEAIRALISGTIEHRPRLENAFVADWS